MMGTFVLNVAVMPYHFGEVVVQHYNSVLCLSKIAAASDAIMLFENEVRLIVCRLMISTRERPACVCVVVEVAKLLPGRVS